MTNVLLKNGTGTSEDRALFKKLRPNLSVEEQVQLATKMGLQYVDPRPQEQEYTVGVSHTFTVMATSEAEAISKALTVANEDYVFDNEDCSLESTPDSDDCSCGDDLCDEDDL
jgi:hypothetical protein